MEPIWKAIFAQLCHGFMPPWLDGGMTEGKFAADSSTPSLTQWHQQAAIAIAHTLQTDCILWLWHLEGEPTPIAYGTAGWIDPSSAMGDAQEVQARIVRLPALEAWPLSDGEALTPPASQIVRLPQGMVKREGWSLMGAVALLRPIAIALQIGYPPDHPSESQISPDELDVICSQVGLGSNLVYQWEQLDVAQQRVALLGRLARLQNTDLHPEVLLEKMVSELAQGVGCDRALLIDLRTTTVRLISTWVCPEINWGSLRRELLEPQERQIIVDAMLRDGVSYLEIGDRQGEEVLQQWIKQMGCATALLIPLFVQEEFWGIVGFLSCTQRLYGLDRLQLARQGAEQVAITLSQVQHYTPLRRYQGRDGQSMPPKLLHDDLTGLMNRQALEQELSQISTRSLWSGEESFSLLICDVDYFKQVNDIHGFRAGDEVLQMLSQRILRRLRRHTPLYRYGGEEFVVVLPGTELSKAVDVAERLRQAIRLEPMRTTRGAIEVTASFGVAQYQAGQDSNAWEVLYRADCALQIAKREGRDRVRMLAI